MVAVIARLRSPSVEWRHSHPAQNRHRESCRGDGRSVRELVPAQLLLREVLLFDHGHRVIAVNPRYEEGLGQRCYQTLKDISEPVDIVDCFRPTRNIPPLAREAIDIGAKVLWMQCGIVNEAAAALARGPGLEVIMNRCMKADLAGLFGDLGACAAERFWAPSDTIGSGNE